MDSNSETWYIPSGCMTNFSISSKVDPIILQPPARCDRIIRLLRNLINLTQTPSQGPPSFLTQKSVSPSKNANNTPSKFNNRITPPLPPHVIFPLDPKSAPRPFQSKSNPGPSIPIIGPIEELTSVMNPRYPNIAGTTTTYANVSHPVRGVQRKYLWRLTIMSALHQQGLRTSLQSR